MVGLVTQNMNFISTQPKAYREPFMDAGTLALFDFGRKYGTIPNTSGAVASGAVAKNLVYGSEADGPSPKFATTTTGGGLVLPNGTSERVQLPGGFMTRPGMRKFVMVFWTKGTKPTGAAGFNNSFYSDERKDGSSNGKFFIIPTYDGSGNISGLDCYGFNPGAAFPATLQDGAVHQWGVEYMGNTDNSQKKIRLFLDGAVAVSGGFGTNNDGEWAAPVTGDYPIFGRSSNRNGTGYKGTLFRGHFHDLSLTSRTSDQIMAQDYAANRLRFS